MTAQACIAFCDRQSYSYAGTEYSGECCKFLLSWSRWKCANLFCLFLQSAGTHSLPARPKLLRRSAKCRVLETQISPVGGQTDSICFGTVKRRRQGLLRTLV